MATRVKGLVVEIGGDTTKLSKAISEADSEIKKTQQDLKDVEKLLKMDPTNIELLTQKEKLLNKEVDQTKDKLNTLKDAQKQLDKQMASGVKVDQQEYDALKREIIATEQQLGSLEKQAKSSNATVSAIFGTMDKVSSKASSIAGATAGVSGAAAGVLGGLFGAGINAAKNADELNTLAKQTGLTTAELQKMQYASDLVDVSVSDMTGALSKMKKQMASDSGAKKFEELGVSIRDADGNMRSASDVFQDTLTALSQIGNETERDTTAMEIFGKGADSLAGIIDDGGAALKAYGQQAEDLGLIMSQDTLDSMNQVNDKMDELKAQAKFTLAEEGAKAMEALMPLFDQIMGALSSLLERIGNIDADTLKTIAIIAGVVAAISPLAGLIASLANPIGLIITLVAAVTALIIANWDKIKAILQAVWDTVKDIFTKIVDWAKQKINAFLSIINGMIGAINKLLSKINEISFDIPDWVPLIGGKTFGFNIPLLKEIPLLANGGIVNNGGSAIVGDAGPELLTMRNGRAYVQPLGGTTVNQTNTFNNYQPRDGQRTLRDLNRSLGWVY